MHQITGSIIICDGDTEIDVIRSSIVITRGKVNIDYPAGFSLIVCSGPFESRHATPAPLTTVKDNSANLLGLVKFFETSQVGVEVAGAEDGVKVARIIAGKPFA